MGDADAARVLQLRLPAGVTVAAPLTDARGLPLELAAGEGYLGFVRHGWLETLGVEMITGAAGQVVLLPAPPTCRFTPRWRPPCSLLGAVKFYLAAAVVLVATIAVLLDLDSRRGDRDLGPDDGGTGRGSRRRIPRERRAAGCAMMLLLLANATAYRFASFGMLFFWWWRRTGRRPCCCSPACWPRR